MQKHYYVYIMASNRNGTLYIGMTGNLIQRVYDHKNGLYSGFTKRYKVNKLVYFELYQNVYDAILREKRMKKWKRQWKTGLIEKDNPEWNDLTKELSFLT